MPTFLPFTHLFSGYLEQAHVVRAIFSTLSNHHAALITPRLLEVFLVDWLDCVGIGPVQNINGFTIVANQVLQKESNTGNIKCEFLAKVS